MLSAKRSAGPYIRVRANGLLRADDYDRFEAEFADELGHRTVPVRLLLDMRGFRGWTPRAFLRDLVWDFRNRQTFSKIAVIGDARWHKWVTAAGALLFRGQLKYFLAIDTAAADQWLQEAPRGTRSMDV